MKKNKLLKTGALALGTVASIAAPIAAVVSCGGFGGIVNKYNTAERSTIKISTTFSANGAQFGTLQAIVDKYNGLKNKPADYKKVELVHIEGGYGTIAPQLKMKFLAESNEIPNMFIDYADAAGQIAWDGMELDLSSAEGQLNKKILKSVNTNIGGTKGNEDLILPIAQSSEMITVNGPLLKYLVTEAGGHFDTTGYVAKINAVSSDDFATTSHGWKAKGTAGKSLAGKKVTDSDFASYEALFALADKLATSQGLSKSDTRRILGLDSGPNALYEMAYSSVKGDDSKFIFSKNKNDGFVDYNLFNKKPQTDLFKNTMEQITNAENNASTKIYGGGAYASSDSTFHQLAISVGSTAGYSHNFIKGGTTSPTVDGTTVFSGSEVTKASAAKGEVKVGDLIFGSYGNPITTNPDSKYGFHVDAASLTKAKDFMVTNPQHVFLVKGDVLDDSIVKASPTVPTQKLINSEGKTTGYLVATGRAAISPDKSTLQKAEMISMPAPSSNKATDTKVAFLQGPGLIGVHNNTRDDKATIAFSKWFTKANESINLKLPHASAAADFDSPLDAWAAGSEYVVAANGKIIGGIDNFEKAGDYTRGNYFVTNLLKDWEAANSTFRLLSPAADHKSGVLRSDLDAIMKASYDTVHNGKAVTAAELFANLNQSAITDEIYQ